jgi:hypothetical protein
MMLGGCTFPRAPKFGAAYLARLATREAHDPLAIPTTHRPRTLDSQATERLRTTAARQDAACAFLKDDMKKFEFYAIVGSIAIYPQLDKFISIGFGVVFLFCALYYSFKED